MTSPVRPSSYTEYVPSPALRGYVDCYWSRADSQEGAPVVHRILPDGAVDIVFSITGNTDAYVVGTMTRALVFARAPNATMFGVRFRAGAAKRVLGVPASAMTDHRVDLRDIWPDAQQFAEPVFDRAAAPATAARDTACVVQAIDRALLQRHHRVGAMDGAVAAAVHRFQATDGSGSVSNIATALGVTRQHLARRFAEHVGVRPKLFARIVRLQRTVARIRRVERVAWSTLALDTGYYDQSHLVTEFRELTGLTPTEFAAQR